MLKRWLEVSLKEDEDLLADLRRVRLQCEMPCVVEHDLGLGIVTFIGFGTWRNEKRIILAPDGQRRRLVFAEELLKLGIEFDVGFIVSDEIELNLCALGAIKQGLIEENGFRSDPLLRIGDAVVILPAGRLKCLEFAQRITVFLGRVLPIRLYRSPVLAEAIYVGISVLRYDRRDSLWKTKCHAKTRRGTVIKNVNRELFKADLLNKVAHHLGNIRKSVLENIMSRSIGKTETGEVGSDHMKVTC